MPKATPTESAWEKGIALAKQTIDTYKQRHNDSIPRKVSYTLWSSEFIETGGATIAQVLYMLGVEPVRDAFGRVSDLKLIPSAELGRPRIDVVVQTSGQLRDIAASRLFLINRAVEMAAAAKDDKFENQVAASVVEAERVLTEKGVSPKDAREMASFRVFGGANGMYGTGIQGMVESGDRWESESEIADTYLNNMGAFYGDEKHWEVFQKFAFEAALNSTDVVVQPRQSNTWGALSLDHVYEFMGGLNLAVRNVDGKRPGCLPERLPQSQQLPHAGGQGGYRSGEPYDYLQPYLYQGENERRSRCCEYICRDCTKHIWLECDEAQSYR